MLSEGRAPDGGEQITARPRQVVEQYLPGGRALT